MFRNRDQRGIEHATLRRRRQHTSQQQPEVVREADLSNQVARKIAAAHEDGRLVGSGDRGGLMRL